MRLRGYWIMNNFDAKYIKISSKYLQEKLNMLESKVKDVYKIEEKKESKLNRLINSIFKS
jgi:hypothetical protein